MLLSDLILLGSAGSNPASHIQFLGGIGIPKNATSLITRSLLYENAWEQSSFSSCMPIAFMGIMSVFFSNDLTNQGIVNALDGPDYR